MASPSNPTEWVTPTVTSSIPPVAAKTNAEKPMARLAARLCQPSSRRPSSTTAARPTLFVPSPSLAPDMPGHVSLSSYA